MKYLKSYWQWTTAGPLWRKIVGFGAAAFVALIIIGAIAGDSETEEPQAADSAIPTSALADARSETTSGVGEVEPTATEAPATPTPAPPTPTPTPVPPTPTPEPIILQGSGDDVLNIQPGPALMHIHGNAGARYFGVVGYNKIGDPTELFVNTTEPYEGTVPLDFYSRDQTVQLEVTATDTWTIEILPLSAARVIEVPGTVSGNGDEVLAVSGQASTAQISGNASARYFAVIGWGNRSDLMVNTTEPYEGRVRVEGDTSFLQITAVGPWEITLE